MFGASSGRRDAAGSGLYTDSSIVRPAVLPDGGAGNGKIVPSTSRSVLMAIVRTPSSVATVGEPICQRRRPYSP
jgi:hypothetical protein